MGWLPPNSGKTRKSGYFWYKNVFSLPSMEKIRKIVFERLPYNLLVERLCKGLIEVG